MVMDRKLTVEIFGEKDFLHQNILDGYLLDSRKEHVFPRGGEAESRDRSQRNQHLFLVSGCHCQLKNLNVLCFKSKGNQQGNVFLQVYEVQTHNTTL